MAVHPSLLFPVSIRSCLLAIIFSILGPPLLLADGITLQDLSVATATLPEVVIYPAREVVTLDPDLPTANAVAVVGDRILAVGSLDELKAAALAQPYKVDKTFADLVIVPGFIAQHDHPLLAALTMTSEIISIEDWVLPDGTRKAASGRSEYLKRLADAEAALEGPDDVLLSWGYHHYFHGELKKSDLDEISTTRPIIVWHRSAHEFFLNSVAEEKYGITKEWFDKLPDSTKEQSDFENAHYWEQGFFALLPRLAPALASPERLRSGLEFVKTYYHANGVTLGCEPGGLLSRNLQDAQNAVLSDLSSPFRFYYIADGKSITAKYANEKEYPEGPVAEDTEELLSWGVGMTAYLPGQVKLFADGAIFSQLMQLNDGYTDGHKGEWIMNPDFFAQSFRVYWDLGYQIHVHVNGDEGLDLVLDTLELNTRRHPRADHRTVIVHFAVSTPQQVERVKRLGAIVSANPYYPVALADNYRSNGMDPERADNMTRMGDVEKARISYSLHSDMPMAPGQPLYLMWSAVNRLTNDGNLRGPEQRISPHSALKAVTIDAAYSLQMERDVGSIEVGKLANFTILANNPLEVSPASIKDISIWGTVQEGRLLPVRQVQSGQLASIRPTSKSATGTEPTESVSNAEAVSQLAAAGLVEILARHQYHD